jgi:integrase
VNPYKRSTRPARKAPAPRERDGVALVTLTDSHTGKRRDFRLGEPGTHAAREAYHRVIAEWEACGRRWPTRWLNPGGGGGGCGGAGEFDAEGITIVELTREYYRWARDYYHTRYAKTIRVVLRMMRRYYGRSPAAKFGPRKLRLLREEMIRGDADKQHPRPAWSRKYINAQVRHVRHMFKWAASQELLPASVHQALCTVEALKRGRSMARENPKVGPVPEHLLNAVLPLLSKPVRTMVDLQLLTGARPGEIIVLRACDLDTTDPSGVWVYRPEVHKNLYRERERLIYFGPQAKQILQPFLAGRPTNAYLFSPAEAEEKRRTAAHAARKTPLHQGNSPGTNRKRRPAKQPGECYTTPSYNRAIQYACDRAFPLPENLRPQKGETLAAWCERLTPSERADVEAWRKEHRWHVHQLRHNAGTNIRRGFGLEAAQLALGHASAQITDAVYAERDRAKVIDIMRKIG